MKRWDWDRLRVDAFACGLSPSEFWRTSPAELALVFKARGKTVEEWHWLAAWHLSPILSMFPGVGTVTPAKLMGKVETVSVDDLTLDADTFKAMMDARAGAKVDEDGY